MTGSDDGTPALPLRRRMATDRGMRARGVIRRPSEGRADEILSVAAALFRDRGYVRTSMADIAEAIGILPGSLYHYIDSKEELLYRIIDRAHRQLIERVQDLPLGTMAPKDALRSVVRIHVEEIGHHLAFGIVSNTDLRELSDDRRNAILELRAGYQRTLFDLIRRGQSERAWCAELDPVLASLTIPAIGNSLTGWYRPQEHRWTVDEIADQYSSMVLRSLSCGHRPSCTGRRRARP